jgi:hypothetical protein
MKYNHFLALGIFFLASCNYIVRPWSIELMLDKSDLVLVGEIVDISHTSQPKGLFQSKPKVAQTSHVYIKRILKGDSSLKNIKLEGRVLNASGKQIALSNLTEGEYIMFLESRYKDGIYRPVYIFSLIKNNNNECSVYWEMEAGKSHIPTAEWNSVISFLIEKIKYPNYQLKIGTTQKSHEFPKVIDVNGNSIKPN